MSPLDVLIWFSIATSTLATASGRRSHERLVKAILPESMTNMGIMDEIVPIDQMDLIINSNKLYGTECPESLQDLPVNAPIYARSICPWYYQLTHDPNRLPSSLPMAVSKCHNRCLGLPEDDYTCDYVFNNVTVLMKEYRDNITRFIKEVRSIPVGLTCVKRQITD